MNILILIDLFLTQHLKRKLVELEEEKFLEEIEKEKKE